MNRAELREMFSSHTAEGKYKEWMTAFCKRKYNSDFAREMSRSVAEYIKQYQQKESTGLTEDSHMTRKEAIENLTLALLYLTRFNDSDRYGAPHNEMAWKNYDFDAINALDEKGLINDTRSSRGRGKAAYLTEDGRAKARKILSSLGIEDKEIYHRFEFRSIRQDEAEEAADIEEICFPPNEACIRDHMKQRIAAAADTFLVAIDRETGRIAGFINGIATDEMQFRDEFFTDASLHDPKGQVLMILGLDVRPEYRKQGLGRELVYNCCRREQAKGRRLAVLTCHRNKVKMYKRMGFRGKGESASAWGAENGTRWIVCCS